MARRGALLGLALLGSAAAAAHDAAPPPPLASPGPDAGTPLPPRGPSRSEIARQWSEQLAPAPGAPEAIGAYANGCLAGGVALSPSGKNHQVMRLGRGRNFGHPALVAYVERLAAEMRRRRLGPLVVGDLSQARGGPTPTGHRSHQSGLDVDLWYTPPEPAKRRRLTRKERESLPARPVVDLGTQTLTDEWNPRLVTLLEVAASDPVVDRVFVHPVMKRELCAQAGQSRMWLARIRPWWGHHDHYHVRLRCPEDSGVCEPLEPVPPDDDGCGEALSWWFSDEPRMASDKRERAAAQAEPAPPPMPERCAPLLEPARTAIGGRVDPTIK